MPDTKIATSGFEELETAAARVRCDHRYPCQPPHGTIWAPGPCLHCGQPHPADDEVIPEALCGPLAAWLEFAATVAREHPQDPEYAGLPEARFCTECQDEETTCVAFVAVALEMARAVNGTTPQEVAVRG